MTHKQVSRHNTHSHTAPVMVARVVRLRPPFVFGVDVSSMLQQQLDDADTVVACGQVEGRGLRREQSSLVSHDFRVTCLSESS